MSPSHPLRLLTALIGVLSCTGDSSGPRVQVENPPERLPISFVVGDTVSGESIDSIGDVDEFAFVPSAGAEFDLFFQALNGRPGTYLQAVVIDPDGNVLADVISFGNDPSLDQATGRFATPNTGVHIVRMLGNPVFASDNVGAYRFFLYGVNRRPETAQRNLVFGDSIAGETIENTADIDEYSVVVPAVSGTNLVVDLSIEAEGSRLLAELVTQTGEVLAATQTSGPGSDGQTARTRVLPGNYTVRVAGGGRTPLRGPYKIRLYRFSFGPESVGDQLTMGDTVTAELINPPGDEDAFWFVGTARQHVNITMRGLAEPTEGGFRAFLFGPAVPPNFAPMAFVMTPTASAGSAHQTLRIDLPSTGRYQLSVTGASTPELLTEIGRYELALTSWSTAPENVSASLAPGDSITTEAIDEAGDWDEFTLTGTPGEELGLLFHSSGTDPIYPSILVFNAESTDSLTNVGQGQRFVGPVRVPTNGRLSIAVFERPMVYFRECYDETCSGAFRFVGAYGFRVVRINRLPESAAPGLAIGDTVRGEAIEQPGDLDEFTASGAPGEILRPAFRLTAPPVGSGYGLSLEIVDPTTGGVLVGQNTQVFGQEFVDYPTFSVPPAGNFIVRIRGTGLFGEDNTTAPYEFFVRR